MNQFQKSLDRYLTSGPEDDYSPYWEATVDYFTDEFYETNEDWIQDAHIKATCNRWVTKCQDKGLNPQQAAMLIQRTHQLYIKSQVK